MQATFRERMRAAFAPPLYLAPPFSGVDISTSGVKVARLAMRAHGFVLDAYAQVTYPAGAFVDGEIADRGAVANALAEAARAAGIRQANGALSESKSYLFETAARGATKDAWRTAIELRLDELIPLPPEEAAFDLIGVGRAETGDPLVVGVGFARRIVDETLAAFDAAGVAARALEGEMFAMARALLPEGDASTTLLIDVGKTTTKLVIVQDGIPRFATTIGIGGHAFTIAVQKHFGVTETEARTVKAERGIVSAPGNEDYLAAMLSTVSAIRDEIVRHFDYWQSRAQGGARRAVSQAILAGGNASLRGLPEYLEGALGIPVFAGDVFTNLASRDWWIPELDYTESLAYATAIGLALYDRADSHA